MGGVVNRHSVEEDEVLVRSATPHIQATAAFGTGLNAGHELQCFKNVDLASQGGKRFDLVYRYADPTHLRHVDEVFFGGHHYLIKHTLWYQPDGELHIALESDERIYGQIADI